MEYEEIIQDVIDRCTKPNVFKFPQSKRLMDAVEKRYGCNLGFLCEKFPKDAIYRNKGTNKKEKKGWFDYASEYNKPIALL